MTRIHALAPILVLGLATSASLAADNHVVFNPDGIKWAAAPPSLPKGAQLAVLTGDPSKEGPFVMRAKFPAGYKIPAHTHPVDEVVTVISGTFHLGSGAKLDQAKGETIKAGGFFSMPQGMQHYAWVTGETIVQINGMGPWGIAYVNQSDDPRMSN